MLSEHQFYDVRAPLPGLKSEHVHASALYLPRIVRNCVINNLPILSVPCRRSKIDANRQLATEDRRIGDANVGPSELSDPPEEKIFAFAQLIPIQ